MFRTRSLLFLLFFLLLFQAKSQNLVPNPGFEELWSIPCHPTVVSLTDFEPIVKDWNLPSDGSSDIFSNLSPTNCYANTRFSTYLYSPGSQAPRSGDNMCGIYTYGNEGDNYREYLQVKLTAPLIIGNKYYAEMYVSSAEHAKYASNNIGMYFSSSLVNSAPFKLDHLPFTPQIQSTSIIKDSVNWVKISGTFTATNAAQYIIIGNFNNDLSTSVSIQKNNTFLNVAYYFIDDVLVKPVCELKDSSSSICKGNSITLDLNDTFITGWSLTSNPAILLSNTSTYVVSPQVTTRYMAHYICGQTSTFEVIVDPRPIFTFGKDTAICKGTSISFDATTEHASYLWQDGSTQPDYTVTKTGLYSVTIKNACGNYRDEIFIHVDTPPTFNFGTDTTICKDEVIHFDAATNGASYLWQDGSTHASYAARESGYYTVTIKNSCGTINENIRLHLCCDGANIPNLITPNGDGMNELFFVDCFGHGDYELNIYNQWGSLVYQNKGYRNNWNAANLSDGIYYFAILFQDKKIHTGWVQVLR